MERIVVESEVSRVVRTNAGMCAVWQPEAFEFDEFEDWEDWATVDQNLVDSAVDGLFVPVNVSGDGVFQVAVRWGKDASLTESEQRCLLASSDPYLFLSKGWFVFGGLEDVGDREFTSAKKISLAAGRYAAAVHLIDWKMDPASVDATGRPTESALPDFVVIIGSASDGPFRVKTRTFERN
jgi:hypothetical protein